LRVADAGIRQFISQSVRCRTAWS